MITNEDVSFRGKLEEGNNYLYLHSPHPQIFVNINIYLQRAYGC